MAEESRLPPNQQLVSNQRWPVVGEKTPEQSDQPWSVSVCGLVQRPLTFQLDELHSRCRTTVSVDVHCVTRWSRLAMEFNGVLLDEVLEAAAVRPEAQFISFHARSARGHSTSLSLEYLSGCGALIALEAEGEPLPADHGGPVRMVVPGRYFYKSVKWLERIDVLAEDRLGYWEQDAGYHNGADPWREQRFVAANVSKQRAAQLIEARDFRSQDLMSIDAAGRELDGLVADEALLRNADFRGASLREASFASANLSGAILTDASLAGASFRNADVEGADFSGADLRGADLRGASLFGASFCVAGADGPSRPAVFDSQTRFELEGLDALTADQAQFVRAALKRSE